MRNRATLLFITVWIPLIGFASDSGLIVPGDRLEVKWWGPSYSATELSVVQTNGTVLLGDCTYARLQGKSRPEAVKAICGLLYVSNGKTNIIQGASVRKIAQIPAPLGFSVFQSGNSNVVFRLINTTTNSVRLPSAGYALSDFYIPVNTNPAYAVVRKPETDVGLWLTRNWRYVGNDWMTASHQEWQDRLRIRTLQPGDHLDI